MEWNWKVRPSIVRMVESNALPDISLSSSVTPMKWRLALRRKKLSYIGKLEIKICRAL